MNSWSPPLHWSEIGKHRILVVGRAERDHKSCISLEPSIQPIAITEVKQRRRAEIVRRVANGNRSAGAHDEIVMIVARVLRKSETRQEEAAQCNRACASHGASVRRTMTRGYTRRLSFSNIVRR
jgi:hypothetical protein